MFQLVTWLPKLPSCIADRPLLAYDLRIATGRSRSTPLDQTTTKPAASCARQLGHGAAEVAGASLMAAAARATPPLSCAATSRDQAAPPTGAGSLRRQLACCRSVPGRLTMSTAPARSSSCTRKEAARRARQVAVRGDEQILVSAPSELSGTSSAVEGAAVAQGLQHPPARVCPFVVGALRRIGVLVHAARDSRRDVAALPPAAQWRQVVRRDAGHGLGRVVLASLKRPSWPRSK